MGEFVDPFEGGGLPPAPEPSAEQLSPDEGEWYQPYPERPRFRVLPRVRWPRDLPPEQGQRWPKRFYVESRNGTVGMVPWPGSHVVWPWEAAWRPDTSAVVTDTKPEPKAKR